jgi:hypothetical protein
MSPRHDMGHGPCFHNGPLSNTVTVHDFCLAHLGQLEMFYPETGLISSNGKTIQILST